MVTYQCKPYDFYPLKWYFLLFITSLDVLHDEARLFNLKTGESERILSAIDSIHNARWSPRKQGIVAIGCNMGLIAIYDAQTKSTLATINPPNESYGLCEDIRWSLGESILLVRYSNLPATLHLFNTDNVDPSTFDPIMTFSSNQDISAVDWVDNISGDFITANTKVGTLRLWNASNQEPKEIIKVVPQGIVTMVPVPGVGGEAVFLA